MSVLKSILRLSLVDGVSAPAKKIVRSLGGLQRQQLSMLAPLRGMTGQLLAFGGAYLGVTRGVEGTVGSALKFESAFADVLKVVDGTDEQMANIRQSIIDMSKELPTTATGIAAIYAAAGQANIPINELRKFTEMTAKVAVAWDTTEGETGQALAEIKNQLGLTVSEVGLFADALNHLSNKSAASAPRLLEFSKRVAANGEMFGFSSEQSLAFGGAMIASGAQAEVAATSFRNMGKALTKGSRATKAQRVALKKLGLDSVKLAKNMQKDALKTTLDVIDKIQSLPEWERISIASALFGDEARGLQPIINNASELRRQLGLVGDEAQYAGSAFDEYLKRASTTGNVLEILRNKIADVFRSIGDDMLPGIRDAALGIGDVIDTLGERASVFDKMGAAIRGFMQGLGMNGDMRTLMNDLGDFFFGVANGSDAADQIGQIFHKFKQWGASIRELSAAINESPITGFFKSLGGYGFTLAASAVGISLFAVAIGKLARMLYFLTGAKAAVGILKTLGGIGSALGLGKKGVSGAKAAFGRTAAVAGSAVSAGKFGAKKSAGGIIGLSYIYDSFAEMIKDFRAPFANEAEKQRQSQSINSTTSKIDEIRAREGKAPRRDILQDFLNSGPIQSIFGTSQPTAKDDGYSTEAILGALKNPPQQDVRVVNKEPPNVTVNAQITINDVPDSYAAAQAAASKIGEETKAAVEATYSD